MRKISTERLVLGSLNDYVYGHERAGIIDIEGLADFGDLAAEVAAGVKETMVSAPTTAPVTPTGATGLWHRFRTSKWYWPVMIGVPVVAVGAFIAKSATTGRILPRKRGFGGMLVSGAQDVSAMGDPGGQRSRFGAASAACRAAGKAPFTKEFGKCMKRELGTE